MPTEKKAVGIWTVRMLTKLNNRVKKQSLTWGMHFLEGDYHYTTIFYVVPISCCVNHALRMF